ncbi:conserved hypothetical protein [Altererythrobacter sp. B11]|uniref:DUF1592 domain-containing protein n=1 Tax=Altererythrobacter sp. B11 TaxID=2060312 RepID=UPI000DC720BC|nr:DUF1592 domain-containing protein [Altererythrobacter sp. B11]BBC73848.1 conserved hypothetical protein [Altererythrobacter sp. B11]
MSEARHKRRPALGSYALAAGLLAAGGSVLARAEDAPMRSEAVSAVPAPVQAAFEGGPPALLDEYCSRCHNDFDLKADFSVDDLRAADLQDGVHNAAWEKILRMVGEGQMPPVDKEQPDPATRAAFVNWLENSLDAYASANPDPGRATLRRLNRVEYANAVRDLLALDVDFSSDLPRDNSGFGFDNIADVLSVSPTLMDRYLAVAGKIGPMATGLAPARPFVTTYQVPKDGSVMNSGRPAYNERANQFLPLGSRGGGAFPYFAIFDGTYEISGWLNANTNNETDREREDRVSVRIPLKAGAHVIGMSFRRTLAPEETVQTLRNTTDYVPLPTDGPVMLPLDVSVDGKRVKTLSVPSYRMHPRYSQQNFPRDVLQIDIDGPYDASGVGQTASRARIFTCRPAKASQETGCARDILTGLARRAYRRPVGVADIAPLMGIYAQEHARSGFERGIEAAVEAILVSPQFLFVLESDPADAGPGSVSRINDFELATRLSLFLWSSIPDEELLDIAEAGRLRQPEVLDGQIDRMLADPRAEALTRNFAGQWLYLRNLDQQRPDVAVFPDFDNRLRAAMASETEMFFSYILRTNRSVLDFIASDYSFLNQQLAEHYGIPGVNGTAFRKVALKPEWNRGGLLGQASILTVTSYGNHTSVVKRGKWILDNLFAAPPPPPPPDVPALEAEHDGRKLSAREQLERHRTDPVCAACHVKMDPLGFALENYDAVGAYRTMDAGQLIDASAKMPNGTAFTGIQGLQSVLLDSKDEFTRAFTERLMTYALARGVVSQDMPAIRSVARTAAQDDYRIRSIIKGIVTSDPFTLRKTPEK